MEENKKPNIIIAILLSLLVLILFFITYTIAALLCSLIYTLLSYVPIIEWLIGMLLKSWDSSFDIVITVTSLIFAGISTAYITSKISKNDNTINLSFTISSIILIIIQSLSLLVNLMYHEAIYINVIMIIFGIIVAVSTIKELKK